MAKHMLQYEFAVTIVGLFEARTDIQGIATSMCIVICQFQKLLVEFGSWPSVARFSNFESDESPLG